MPWCDECTRFYSPATLTSGGDCPDGHHVADPVELPPVPWHFKLLVGALVVYLGWRAAQFAGGVVG